MGWGERRDPGFECGIDTGVWVCTVTVTLCAAVEEDAGVQLLGIQEV